MSTSVRIAAKLTSLPLGPDGYDRLGGRSEVAGSSEAQGTFPQALVLLIEQSADGFLLIRYDAGGAFAGDTWHPNVEEAKEQAISEFGASVSDWSEVPVDVNDIVAFMNSH